LVGTLLYATAMRLYEQEIFLPGTASPWLIMGDNGHMKKPYEWLYYASPDKNQAQSFHQSPSDGDIPWQQYPLDASLITAGFEKTHLALGMALFYARHEFTEQAVGQLIPIGDFKVEFTELTFAVNTLNGGRIIHRERDLASDVTYTHGIDLFRYTRQFHVTPILDGSQNCELIALTIGRSILDLLIGEEMSERLLNYLGLDEAALTLKKIPKHVNFPLWNTLEDSNRGPMRALNYQARVLDYLSLLTRTIGDSFGPKGKPSLQRAHAIHDHLISLEGKLPSLEQLAKRFGRSARVLNDDFVKVYGKPIVTFVTDRRLEQVHQAIAETPIPLKVLADRLGYSHVNHFNIAFRRKFGYPPGKLRRTVKNFGQH
jgi:AraC-like DNA-binding protein